MKPLLSINRLWSLIRLSSASPIEPPAESRRFPLQSGLDGASWGGSATQEEADAAALKHAAFSASLKNLTWEDFTPVFGACFVHNRWWQGEGSCPFCKDATNSTQP